MFLVGSGHLQIAAASFVPREEVTAGKLGETRLERDSKHMGYTVFGIAYVTAMKSFIGI
jgi:hypothetical protein